MTDANIFIIDPFTSGRAFIETLFGECLVFLFGGLASHEFYGNFLKTDDVVFTITAQSHIMPLEDILPCFTPGEHRAAVKIFGYIFLLYADRLDFDATQGDLVIKDWMTIDFLMLQHHRHPFVYTSKAKRDMAYFQQTAPDVPTVVVLLNDGSKQDVAALDAVREGFGLRTSIPILACDINDKAAYVEAVIALLREIDEFPDREGVVQMLAAL